MHLAGARPRDVGSHVSQTVLALCWTPGKSGCEMQRCGQPFVHPRHPVVEGTPSHHQAPGPFSAHRGGPRLGCLCHPGVEGRLEDSRTGPPAMGGIAAEVVGGECLKFPLRRKSAFLSEHLRPQVAGNRDLEVSNCIPLPCVCHSVPYSGHRRRLCETELGAALPVRERETQRHTETHRDTQRHTETQRTHRDTETQRDTEAHRDTQRHRETQRGRVCV